MRLLKRVSEIRGWQREHDLVTICWACLWPSSSQTVFRKAIRYIENRLSHSPAMYTELFLNQTSEDSMTGNPKI